MAISRRETALLAGGLVLGLAGAWALFGRGDASPPADAAQAEPARSAPAAAAAPQRVASADLCSFDRVIAPSGDGDGQLRLEAELAGKGASDVRDLLVRGKEAAASGHQRDAETAFMMACRAAGKLSGKDDMLLADAMYRLGSHYAAVESAAPQGKRGEIRERARSLYATSLEAYRAKYGDDHERTRFAEKGLATLGGSASDAKMVAAATPKAAEPAAKPAPEAKKAPAPAPAPAVEATQPPPAVVQAPKPSVAQAPRPPVVAAAPKPPAVVVAPQPDPVPPPAAQGTTRPVETAAATKRRARPSFDCDKARSTTEKIICADDDLARQDRELGRLHARAKQASDDPRDFQRRSDAAWSSREANCSDRACLQRWYAQRRAELSREAAAPAPRRDSESESVAVREPRRSIPAVVAPAPAAGEASIGQATGDAGDTSQ